MTDNPSVEIYVNQIENRITFRIKAGYYLELLTPEMMKLLESTENKITKGENDENVSHLEMTEVVLVHCKIVNNDFQHDSRDLNQLLNISPKKFISLKNSEFSYIEVWFTDQNCQPLEIEDKINITLVIN